MAAPRLVAAGRIAADDQGQAAVAEIAGVAGVFRDLPQAGQANSVRMHQTAEASSIGAPTQVGGGIDGALGGLAKGVGRTERQDDGEQTAQRDGVYRQGRLPVRPPCSLVGIGEQRFAYVGEARTGVRAVFIGDAFYPKRTRTHGGALTLASSRSPWRWRRQIVSDLITASKPALPRSFTNDEGIPFRVIRRPYSLSAESSAGLPTFRGCAYPRACLGEHCETSPSEISASGSRCRRAGCHVARRGRTRLSVAAGAAGSWCPPPRHQPHTRSPASAIALGAAPAANPDPQHPPPPPPPSPP